MTVAADLPAVVSGAVVPVRRFVSVVMRVRIPVDGRTAERIEQMRRDVPMDADDVVPILKTITLPIDVAAFAAAIDQCFSPAERRELLRLLSCQEAA